VLEQLKFVVPESWEFSHDPDDQTHSIAYTVTFVMIGEGRRIPDPSGQAPVNPTEFPGNPVDLGPWDPWQIILGIGTSSQPNGLEYGGGGSPGASSPPSVGGTTGGGIGGYDPTDFIYGNVVPGYTIDQLFAAAKASAPEGGTAIPMHVMKNGEIFYHGDTPGVEIKYSQSDGTNTIWIPLPPPTPGITTASGSTSSYTPPVDTDATTTTTDGNRTLEEIADNEYGDPSYWEEIYAQNEKFLNEFGVTKFNAQAQVFPVGLKIAL
jgi:hypothetical protein